MFAKAQLMNTINADEVVAVGAATQASILTEKVDIALNDRGSFTVLATTHDMVFLTEGEEHQVLIPASCPIPVRRSHHLPSGQEVVTVKVFIRAQKQLLAVTEVIKSLFCTSEKFFNASSLFLS
jgi:molecular chaperone DnaK (HSP70)